MRKWGFLVGAAALAAVVSTAGAQSFTRITTGPHVNDGGASRAVCWIDYDGDQDLDIFLTNGPSAGQNNALFRNDGGPAYTFTKITGDPIVQDAAKSDGASFADYDNDGDLDCFVVNWYGDNNLFYSNDGDGTFTQILTGPFVTDGGHSETCSFGDYDRDGKVDLYVTNSGNGVANAEANFLYHNDGGGNLSRVLVGPAVTDVFLTRSANWIDYDQDGDDDLFVTNEENQQEILYQNQLVPSGTATFTTVAPGDLVTWGGSSFSGAWGDFDNDGDFDCFVANSGGQDNSLFRNDGGTFTRLSSEIVSDDGGWSVCGAWGDMDNDGDLDLFVTNAFGGGAKRNFLYRNRLRETGSATFEKISTGVITTDTGWSYGFAWGDYDQDGDLDVYVARTISNIENESLYRNDLASGARWLELSLAGTASNRAALGAIVRIKATIGGQVVQQRRVVEGQAGYCSQNLDLHFGLGDAVTVDELEVIWPSGAHELLTGVPTNQRRRLVEGSIAAPVEEPDQGILLHGGRGGRGRTEVLWHRVSPNPSFGEALVEFALRQPAQVRLDILSLDGRRIATLLDGMQGAGLSRVRWRRPESGAAGTYLYRISTSGGESMGKFASLR